MYIVEKFFDVRLKNVNFLSVKPQINAHFSSKMAVDNFTLTD